MAGERRKRQQRVRHEAGGSTSAGSGSTADQPQQNSTVAANAGGGERCTGGGGAARGGGGAARGGGGAARGGGGAARGGGRGRGGGSRGCTVAVVDESKYYQPVTIMESKGGDKGGDGLDELDEAPRTYRRRAIVSNWSRYEERCVELDELEDGRDYLIGEDYTEVLQNQSMGGGGGGHLQLKGEEGWEGAGLGSDGGGLFSTEHGLGALRLSDLANTLATIPFLVQLNLPDAVIPKQLAEYYSELADDNRQLYDPDEDPNSFADSAEIVEQQVASLRNMFFGDSPPGAKDKAIKNMNARMIAKNKKQDCLINNFDADIDDPFAASEDLALLSKAMKEDAVESEEVKLDLTEKMCQAFGSDINSLCDDFSGFIAEAGDDDADAKDELPATETLPNKLSEETHAPNDLQNVSSVRHETSNSLDNETKKYTDPNTIGALTIGKNDTAKEELVTKQEGIGLDFSSGTQTSFSFGLPKLGQQVSSNISTTQTGSASAQKLSKKKKEEDFDVFTPVVEVKKKVVAEEQPIIDLDAPIVPKPVALVTTEDDTKDLEDWLDSVLDD